LDVRRRLGRERAKAEPLKQRLGHGFIVVPAPKTAISAAEAYAEELGLRVVSAIEKVDGSRGFINEEKVRRAIMSSGYIFHRSLVEGNKVIVFDDSVVRGETSKIIVFHLRDAGALEVHLRLTEPPIKFPCFYGIDFPDPNELGVNKVGGNLEKLAKEIDADSVVFQSIAGLIRGVGRKKRELCMACVTGDYPTRAGEKLCQKAMQDKR
jgi:amidophosphoribosyltransferase